MTLSSYPRGTHRVYIFGLGGANFLAFGGRQNQDVLCAIERHTTLAQKRGLCCARISLLDKGVSNHEKQACCTAILGGGSCQSVLFPSRDGVVPGGRSDARCPGSRSARRD